MWPRRIARIKFISSGTSTWTTYWSAVEHCLQERGPDLRAPVRACLDYRGPLDLGEQLELARHADGDAYVVGFVASGVVKAVARVAAIA